jgi:hypothetical protein
LLNVFLTIDTEIWPHSPGWPVKPLPSDKCDFTEEIAAYIYGTTPKGDFGLPYQTRQFKEHGLKANYFVETLFSERSGDSTLTDVVNLIQNHDHEVQLHLHTEWLSEISDRNIPAQFREFMHQYSLDEQTALIKKGIQNLHAAGVENIHAFRAGSYGANLDTLRALLQSGILYDTSYNPCYLGSDCTIQTNQLLLQPEKIEGIWEFPISFFQDYPGHRRHAQLCACSFYELKTALLDAWKNGWFSFVVVLHSFELVKKREDSLLPLPDKIAIERFQLLCDFLSANRDKFNTALFSEIDTNIIPKGQPVRPLRSRFIHTACRFAEQGLGRLN